MLRLLMRLVTAAVLCFVSASALAQAPSADTVQAIRAATEQAQGGDPAGAMQTMLDMIEGLPAADPTTNAGLPDRAMLSFFAGGFAQMIPDHERALTLYMAAANDFGALGAAGATSSATAFDYAAGVLRLLGRKQEAYETLMLARDIRREAGAPLDAATINSLRLAGLTAQELGNNELVAAEFQAAVTMMLRPDGGGHELLTAQAAAQAADTATWLGAYPLADLFADQVAGLSNSIALGLWHWTPERDEQRPYICNELADLLRQMAGLRIDYANYGGAESLLSIYGMPGLVEPMACADALAKESALFNSTLKARLFLRTGDPFSAHLRLLGYEDGLANADLAPDVRLTSDAIARARQAEARLALGFPGEAGEFLAQSAAGGRLSAHPAYEREHLLASATKALIDRDVTSALDILDAADTMMKQRSPLHWLPRAEIAYRRALILLEEGRRAEALSVRDGFEAELEELVSGIRGLGQGLVASLQEEQTRYDQQILGEDVAEQLKQERADGRTETPAFRELDRMRLLFDLSIAAHDGDEAAARTAFEASAQTGLPGSVGLTSHVHRAYLLGCLMVRGNGIECSTAIRWAFDYPAVVPHRCVDGCAWIGSEATDLAVSADMFRRAPLVTRFAEPVLAWLVRAADEAAGRGETGNAYAGIAASPASDGDGAFALSLGRWNGADVAFEAVQRMVEGGAAAAVGQIGSRLASGSGEVAGLMRERQEIARQVDALFRGGEAETGEMARLSDRLRHLAERLGELRPDHAELFDPSPMSAEDISSLLPAGSAFVMVSTTQTATYVFAVRDGQMDWHRAPVGAADLEARVSALRVSLDPDEANRGATPLTGSRAPRTRVFDRALAHGIYRDLLEPVATFLGNDDLYVVINGPLSSLPLSLLVRDEPEGDDDDPAALRQTQWLARTHAVTLLPSPAALRLAELQRSRPRADLPFIGFGDPVFSAGDRDVAPFGRLAALPGTRAEINRLAELLDAGADDVFLGGEATKEAILGADLSRARVLAFATHGLLAGQMSQAYEPGLVFTHPRDGATAEESYLTASEAATLDINADWVLLSACNTAGPDGRPDAEGLSGLARAFLFAGARSVLVSYWPVRDDAAMMLTTEALRWYGAHPSASRAQALRHAMVSLLERDNAPDLAHPSAWAPFVLLGDG